MSIGIPTKIRGMGLLFPAILVTMLSVFTEGFIMGGRAEGQLLTLPKPAKEGILSVEEALDERRSVRQFDHRPLELAQVSQLLWAAQGITSPLGFRTAPSAGALYPLEVYLVTGKVNGLEPGVYKYHPQGHVLAKHKTGDQRQALSEAALDQSWIEEASAIIVITAIYERTTRKYGGRGARYVLMDAGHASENVYLEATALELGTVLVGAFDDEDVKDALGLPTEEEPLCILPVGRPQ